MNNYLTFAHQGDFDLWATDLKKDATQNLLKTIIWKS